MIIIVILWKQYVQKRMEKVILWGYFADTSAVLSINPYERGIVWKAQGFPSFTEQLKLCSHSRGRCQHHPSCYWKLLQLQPVHYLTTEHCLSTFFCRPRVESWRRMPQSASPSTATQLPTTRPRSTSPIPPMNVLSHWIWNITSQLRCSKSFQSSPKAQRIQVM